MSDAKRPDNDPSMDDILASIRKIISDDEARAQAGNTGGGQPSAPADVPPVELMRGTRASTASGREDVLLLTDLIEEPQPATPAAPPPTPIPMPRIDPVVAAEMPQPTVVEPAAVMPAAVEPAPKSAPFQNADTALIGAAVAGAASSAFDRLSQAVKQGEPRLAPAPDPGLIVGAGGKTLEEVVKEMLRPMLKEWLDKNLPPMVERLVEREIVRLTRR